MAKYSLDLYVISNDQTTLDDVLAALPGPDDPTVWPDEYAAPVQGVNESGDKTLSGVIRFNADTDRAAVEDAVKNVAGVFSDCEPGSYLRLHICHHDEIPPKPCEVTTLYEVKAI